LVFGAEGSNGTSSSQLFLGAAVGHMFFVCDNLFIEASKRQGLVVVDLFSVIPYLVG